MDQHRSSEIGELWSDSGYTMKPTGFANELVVGERGTKGDSKDFGLSNCIKELLFIEVRLQKEIGVQVWAHQV